MPLLGALLGLNLPENDFTRTLEPQYRKSALHALLEECLSAAARDEPLLLILEDVHYREFTQRGEHQLEDLLQPIGAFLIPLFFVLMGMRVDLSTFARGDILGFAAVLTLAAIIGKQACALGVLGGKLDRLSIGVGMIPRGEVGLIFASIGLGLTLNGEPIVDSAIYSAVVIMVIVTTMATPPALRWSLSRRKQDQRATP